MTMSRGGNADNPSGRPGTKPDWSRRMWATWLDIMVFLLALVPFVGFAQLTAQPTRYGSGEELTPAGIVAAWVGILVYLALWSWNRYVRQARTGQTIGKRRQGLRVVDAQGRTPTAGRLLVRDLAHVLDILPACLGLLWPIWDRRGQTFADKIVGTLVVTAVADAAAPVATLTGPADAPVPPDAVLLPTATEPAPTPGEAPVAPRPTDERRALIAFFRSVDRDDVIALPPSRERFDQDEGHDDAEELARQRGIADPSWLFWHRQAAAVFDDAGNLTGPLRINWGGSDARVAEVLASLPAPFRAESNGPRGVFEIHSDALPGRQALPLPDVTDTKAVKARIKAITMQRRRDAEWSDAEVAWMNDVLARGEVAAQGYVVRWLAGSERLTDEAYEVLVDRWRRIYAAAPRDVVVTPLLRTLERRGDPRLEEVVEVCLGRSRYTFAYGVAAFLAERGDPADVPRLYRLAQTPGKYVHSPGNSVALKGWVSLRAAHEGRPVADVAAEALGDPAFDEAARRRLAELAES